MNRNVWLVAGLVVIALGLVNVVMGTRMVPTMDRSKATLLVKVHFDERDPRVLPDMSAKVAFLSKPVPQEQA